MPEKYHAVSLRPKNKVRCKVVTELEKRMFLSSEAPRLPLEGCTNQTTCQCVYKHHDDRRVGPRRAFELGLPARAYAHDRRSPTIGAWNYSGLVLNSATLEPPRKPNVARVQS